MSIVNNRSKTNIEESGLKCKSENFNIILKTESKKVPCLRCGKKFLSDGLYNRICAKCNSINERIRAARYPVISKLTELVNKAGLE